MSMMEPGPWSNTEKTILIGVCCVAAFVAAACYTETFGGGGGGGGDILPAANAHSSHNEQISWLLRADSAAWKVPVPTDRITVVDLPYNPYQFASHVARPHYVHATSPTIAIAVADPSLGGTRHATNHTVQFWNATLSYGYHNIHTMVANVSLSSGQEASVTLPRHGVYLWTVDNTWVPRYRVDWNGSSAAAADVVPPADEPRPLPYSVLEGFPVPTGKVWLVDANGTLSGYPRHIQPPDPYFAFAAPRNGPSYNVTFGDSSNFIVEAGSHRLVHLEAYGQYEWRLNGTGAKGIVSYFE